MKGKTEFRNGDVLVAALVGLGFAREHIEVHEQPQPVMNYYGREDQMRAHVIIRNQHAPGTIHREDLAWVREEDGTFSMILDDMTREGHTYGPAWQQRLRQGYGVAKAHAELGKLGLRGEAVPLEDGRIRIRALAPRQAAGLRGR